MYCSSMQPTAIGLLTTWGWLSIYIALVVVWGVDQLAAPCTSDKKSSRIRSEHHTRSLFRDNLIIKVERQSSIYGVVDIR